jgi:Holliday junction resolvase RusA-like endonuclease
MSRAAPSGEAHTKHASYMAETCRAAEPITVVIAGEPVAKGRPRMTRGGHPYTPSHTRRYEAHGRLAAQLAMGDRPPLDTPVRVVIGAELPVPTTWSGRKRTAALAGEVVPSGRPDLDNLAKGALDAIRSIVVVDDALVVEMTALKRFSAVPRLVVTVQPLAAQCSNRAARPRNEGPGEVVSPGPSSLMVDTTGGKPDAETTIRQPT